MQPVKNPSRDADSALISSRQQEALLHLLADEDPMIHQEVRGRILALGQVVLPRIKAAALSDDAVLRLRAREILDLVTRRQSDEEMLAFCLSQGEDLDLERGVWLLAQSRYPEISLCGYQALIDNYAADLRQSLHADLGPEQIIAVINEYLFGKLGFRGNEVDYFAIENNYFNQVIDKRIGNPINLCLLYLFLGRRLRLPIAGIGMPEHFICRYQSSIGEYYIDAFHYGKLLSKGNCVEFLSRSPHGFRESYLDPVSPRSILSRICHNLYLIYWQLGDREECTRIRRYILALSRA